MLQRQQTKPIFLHPESFFFNNSLASFSKIAAVQFIQLEDASAWYEITIPNEISDKPLMQMIYACSVLGGVDPSRRLFLPNEDGSVYQYQNSIN